MAPKKRGAPVEAGSYYVGGIELYEKGRAGPTKMSHEERALRSASQKARWEASRKAKLDESYPKIEQTKQP